MSDKLLKLPINTTEIPVARSKTSANILCKYMRRPEYLFDILKSSAIKPRYVEEIINYLDIPHFDSISIPMICFCDIPLTKVSNHISEYGEYGIAFDKEKCIARNVQPIMYINPDSLYFDDMREAINVLLNSSEMLGNECSVIANFLLTQLLYSKPIIGEMNTDKGRKKLLFKDECEWRFVPKLPEDMSVVLPAIYSTDEGRKVYSDALALPANRDTWFHFSLDDISYLIVPDEDEASQLIDYINKALSRKYDRKTRNKLISKIEVTSKNTLNY